MSLPPNSPRAVRDLAWACFSPPLLHSEQLAPGLCSYQPALTPARKRRLQQLASDPTPLLAHLAGRTRGRLGIYFEALWHYFLSTDPAVDLLAHNLPVRDGGRTLGEFDCLYYCHEQRRFCHLELAVKFYLDYDGRWLGPNSRDRLDLKLGHMLERQSRLADHPAAAAVLADLGVRNLQRQLVIKGALFQSVANPGAAPPAFNRDCGLHHWLAIDQLAAYLRELPATCFVTLDKSQWLAETGSDDPVQALAKGPFLQQITAQMNTDGHAQLIAAIADQGREIGRFFVTPSDWPAALQ